VADLIDIDDIADIDNDIDDIHTKNHWLVPLPIPRF